MEAANRLASGVFFGVAACMIWGFVYLVPLLIPEYDPMLIAAARYSVFGLVSIPIAVAEIRELRLYSASDWILSAKLGIIGNIIYYWCLAQCVRHSGAPVAGMCMALIPVLTAAAANFRAVKGEEFVPWKRLIPGLILIALGFSLANATEFDYIVRAAGGSGAAFWYGLALGLVGALIWTWYPLRVSGWMRANPARSSAAWSTAQGLTAAPAAFLFYAAVWGASPAGTPLLGERPLFFLGLMIVLALVCSWFAMILWNAMSKRLPAALAGQMIVFETIFAVLYAHVLRREAPAALLAAGLVLLILGVLASLRAFRSGGGKKRFRQ